jgi:hypothetical protein
MQRRAGSVAAPVLFPPARVAALLFILVAACAPATTDNADAERAFAEHQSNIEVTARGTVTRVLGDESGPSGTHQRFVIRLVGSAQTVLIDNNVTIGTRVPAALDDEVVAHGEYVWNDQGGLIHFTHHDPARTHDDGWIELRGVRYS